MNKGLVVVGSVALDSVEANGAVHDDVLGGSASFFSTAASYFAPVKLVAVVGDDMPEQHLKFLGSRGVDLTGLERARGKTFRWKGRYSDDLGSRTTLDTQLNVFAEFKPKLPEAWRDGEFLFLGNIHPALQLDVLTQVKKPKLVAMDTMNFWIEGEPAALARVLERVDLLVINDEEARLLSKEHNLPRAARAIRAMGPKTVIVKRGESGALLFHEHGVFAAPAYPLERVVDPTGAGDTFAGGFMGYLARVRDIGPQAVRRAMFYGSVMASFCVEDYSLDRLRALTDGEIEGRYRAFRDLTHFEDVRLA
ncbi:MAG TPA: PfkB family carbohydrate kinase [Polyangia bacterium]|jgi:sugar/nucleoside kinase (ribokinase family)|nr:PfkB family carbohydrate kinase [Polyangia bacterium]